MLKKILFSFIALLFLTGCQNTAAPLSDSMKNTSSLEGSKTAIFAGGCFWCVEYAFEKYPGVYSVTSGFSGGTTPNPTYEKVASGQTDYLEAVLVEYDPDVITYKDLVEVFWRSTDPTDAGGTFYDRGHQYTTAIFYENEIEKNIAQKSKEALASSGRFDEPIVTQILPRTAFYPVEEYHQDYYKKEPEHYNRYKKGSGRDEFYENTWGEDHDYTFSNQTYEKPSAEAIKQKLTDLEYEVTQKDATERAFDNKYWDNKSEGIYVDIVSGEPLFSSTDKYDSGTGWPSFTKPIDKANIKYKTDKKLGMTRTEVRSDDADSHLGHVFDDGPGPEGKRYCINSAALRFVPKEDLGKEGYGEYEILFD